MAAMLLDPSKTTVNADAKLDVVIAENGLEARIGGYAPPQGDGKPVTLDRIKLLARYAGVAVPLELDAVNAALERIAAGQDPVGLVIARGSKPTPTVDAHILWKGDTEKPVFPGDPMGVLVPATESMPGRSVDGMPIYASETRRPQDLEIPTDSGILFQPATGELVAKRYGLVRLNGRQVRIRGLLAAADDLMSVKATVCPQDFYNEPTTPARYRQALNAEGYRAELSLDSLQAGLAQARESAAPVEGVVIGIATRPKNGEDGWFEPKFERLSAASVCESGRIDYSERGAVKSVQPGAVLGTLHPAKPGVPGMNILGQALPARDGRACRLKAGENVELAGDSGYFVANAEGVVVCTREMISVSDLFEVNRNVDYGLGNLRLKKGSVRVSGNVLSGFTISAPGNAVVGGTVEAATIEAGGDVVVHGGLVMGGRGSVVAKGSVSARFAERASITAGADVIISNAINDCSVLAEGKVVCLCDRGQIAGGEIRCGLGVEAVTLGSAMGVTTRIILGLQIRKDEELLAEMRMLREQIAKIQSVLGEGAPQEILLRTPPAKREAVGKLIAALSKLLLRREVVRDELDALNQQTRRSLRAVVKVQQVVYPGVEVVIGGAGYTVAQAMKGVLFSLDQDTMQVTCRGLR